MRDKLLIKEVEELERTIPSYVSVKFDNPDRLYDFRLVISPEEGDWMGGHFRFHVQVPEGYNIEPPTVTCQSKLWHPNITPEGEVCLSLLRFVLYRGDGCRCCCCCYRMTQIFLSVLQTKQH